MKFKNTQVFNFEGALRGMRNPMNSWAKSDSFFGVFCEHENPEDAYEIAYAWTDYETKDLINTEKDIDDIRDEIYDQKLSWLYKNGMKANGDDYHFLVNYIGPNDLDLAQRLIAAGPEHRKFMRQIFVSVDITAPLYWWKEFDTYKVGTTANSTSTMHKLASTEITLDCFETSDLSTNLYWNPSFITGQEEQDVSLNEYIGEMLHTLEGLRQKYNETKDKRYWKELIRWLPNGWLQTRTVTMNYENLRSMSFQREYHKLVEWHQFCDWVKTLPYAEELILYTKE